MLVWKYCFDAGIFKIMKKNFLVALLLLSFLSPALAQQDTWDILSKVTILKKKDPSGKYQVEYPVFGREVKALDGREITIKGYIIPVEEFSGQNYFVFSALPFNLCYFCGGAGPETVMEVYAPKKIPYTSKAITLKGKLKLNGTDGNHLMYILENAVLVP